MDSLRIVLCSNATRLAERPFDGVLRMRTSDTVCLVRATRFEISITFVDVLFADSETSKVVMKDCSPPTLPWVPDCALLLGKPYYP